ncbi:hypothetical protein CHARACLAT_020908 [Characodon lateralis]|uniref:Uncharacterized protein n=1 Tax=Characodon lateralis TaxID=208331 RepID=A0ABU7DIE7_9TELE|nr:hypothetical protein [Characodon lateralis]
MEVKMIAVKVMMAGQKRPSHQADPQMKVLKRRADPQWCEQRLMHRTDPPWKELNCCTDLEWKELKRRADPQWKELKHRADSQWTELKHGDDQKEIMDMSIS